jgi:Tfp pilus assembly protein PilO
MLSKNQVSLPRTAALPSFIGHLQRQAAVAGVSFKNWSREDEEPVAGYIKVPVAIEVVGSFHQILKYFYLLSKTKRIITVENFSLSQERSESEEVLLKAKFRATTFRQEGPPVEADAVEKPESGMINKAKAAKEKKEQQLDEASGETPAKSGIDRLKNPGAN